MNKHIIARPLKAIYGITINPIFFKIKGIIILMWFSFPAFSQTADTIFLQRNDTIIKLISPGNPPEKLTGLKLEDLLRKNSERNFFSRNLHKWLVKSSFDHSPQLPASPQDYTGKTIKSINLISIPPFGGSIYDTITTSYNWLERLGNNLRFETAPRIIHKTITIEEGTSLSKMDFADSERLLRTLPFINDARITGSLCSTDSSYIDVTIFVQDRYPHAVSVNIKDERPQISLINKNILGRGFSIHNTLAAPTLEDSKWGFREILKAENLMGRYLKMEMDYSNISDRHFFSGSLNKSFLLPKTKYAGGLSFNRSFANPNLSDHPFIEWEKPLNYRRQNYWLGRSFRLNSVSNIFRSNFYILGRFLQVDFLNTPKISLSPYRGGRFFFSGIAISKRSYYRNNLIYSFGKTEDVPFGLLSTISYGHHRNDSISRHFLALHYSLGKALIPSKGYLYFSADLSTFFNKNTSEQGNLNLRAEYISPLIPVGTNQLRSFFELQYVKGFNRLEDEKLFIDEKVDGLRGFNYRNRIRGSEKAILKSEQVFFTRLQPLGFKFAIFSFLDIAFLNENNSGLFDHSPYFSFGAGLRIRNDHMVFNTLQIRLAIIPRLPSGEFPASFRITGEPVKNFRDFDPKQPGSSPFY